MAKTAKTYEIQVADSAARDLAKLGKKNRQDWTRIKAAIDSLKHTPRPATAKTLQGEPAGVLRIRVGDYRVLYTIDDDVLVVLVVAVGHRRDVYR